MSQLLRTAEEDAMTVHIGEDRCGERGAVGWCRILRVVVVGVSRRVQLSASVVIAWSIAKLSFSTPTVRYMQPEIGG